MVEATTVDGFEATRPVSFRPTQAVASRYLDLGVTIVAIGLDTNLLPRQREQAPSFSLLLFNVLRCTWSTPITAVYVAALEPNRRFGFQSREVLRPCARRALELAQRKRLNSDACPVESTPERHQMPS